MKQVNEVYVDAIKFRHKVYVPAFGKYVDRGAIRYQLTDRGERYLAEHYADNFTQDIAKEFGISARQVSRYASERGLRKSHAFMRDSANRASRAAKMAYLVMTDEAKAERNRRCAEILREHGKSTRFGTDRGNEHLRNWMNNPDRRSIMSAARRKLLKSEKARVAFGYEQKTKIHFRPTMTMKKYKQTVEARYRLIHYYDCRIQRGSFAVESSEKVSKRFRDICEKLGFIFRS